jgi:hypothetical protein
MIRRDWWLSVVVVGIAVLLHALFPRYHRPADTAERTVEGLAGELGPVETTPPARPSSVPDLDALGKEPGDVEIRIPLPIIKSEPAGTLDEINDVSRPLVGVRGRSKKMINRPRATCEDDGAVRPRLGAELVAKEDRRGSGRLQIDNRTGSDTVATLLEDPNGTPRRAILIRSGARGFITFVRSGRYRLRFQTRSDWLVGEPFRRHSDTSEFDEAFDFREISSESGGGYATYHVTLRKPVASTRTGATVSATSSRFCIS